MACMESTGQLITHVLCSAWEHQCPHEMARYTARAFNPSWISRVRKFTGIMSTPKVGGSS